MKKVRLKKPVIYGMYAVIFALLLGALYYADFSNSKLADVPVSNTDDDYKYVSRLFGDDTTAVVSTDAIILRPYTDSNVKVLQGFYNYQATEGEQESSIINYEQTYIQNSGVIYGGVEKGFDVVSALNGTVTSVKEDKLLGNIVEIKNSDKVVTIYQGLSEVTVKENDAITQGMVIGKSGESNMNKNAGKHIVFKLKVNGVYVNPEEYYDKNLGEL